MSAFNSSGWNILEPDFWRSRLSVFFGWLFERRPKPHRLINQPGIERILEHRTNAAHFVAQRHRSPLLGYLLTEPAEVVSRQVINKPFFPEDGNQSVSGSLVIVEGPRGDFAGVEEV